MADDAELVPFGCRLEGAGWRLWSWRTLGFDAQGGFLKIPADGSAWDLWLPPISCYRGMWHLLRRARWLLEVCCWVAHLLSPWRAQWAVLKSPSVCLLVELRWAIYEPSNGLPWKFFGLLVMATLCWKFFICCTGCLHEVLAHFFSWAGVRSCNNSPQKL